MIKVQSYPIGLVENRLAIHSLYAYNQRRKEQKMIAKNQIVEQTEYPHIVKITGVCGGQAIIEGTRIAVWHLVGYYYKVGLPVEEILAEWDYLTPAQVFSALAYYHDHRQEIDEVRQKNSPEHRIRWRI